jgi:hypothetical protein
MLWSSNPVLVNTTQKLKNYMLSTRLLHADVHIEDLFNYPISLINSNRKPHEKK